MTPILPSFSAPNFLYSSTNGKTKLPSFDLATTTEVLLALE